MKRALRTLLSIVGPCLVLSACAAGSTMYVPGDLARPARAVAPAAGGPAAGGAGAGAPRAADRVPIRLPGGLRRFEVNPRRTGNLSVVTEATVSLTVTAEG